MCSSQEVHATDGQRSSTDGARLYLVAAVVAYGAGGGACEGERRRIGSSLLVVLTRRRKGEVGKEALLAVHRDATLVVIDLRLDGAL